MKKILYLALAAVLALSCGGKKNNAHTNTGYILGLAMEDKYSFTIDDEGAFIPVVADPAGAKLASLALVSCNPDDVIDATLTDTGVSITPKKIGSTTLTVQSVANEDIKATCTVAITAVPAAPKSVAVVKTGSHFIDGNLVLGNGEDFQLEAKVTDVNNAVSSFYKVAWSLVSGADYIDLTSAGKVSAKANGTAQVKVEVENYPAISTTLTVKVLQAPTSISFIYTGSYTPNNNGEIVMKKGKSTSFMINVQPADAIAVVNVSVANSQLISASVSGKTVTVTGVGFTTTSATTLTISSPYNSSITKNIKFYVFEYDKNDVKPGDYVYTNGTQVRSADSGIRHLSPIVYVDPATGNLTSKPTFPGTSLPGYSGYSYIGVVAQNFLPDDNDFLGCSYLSQCRDKSNAAELYHYAVRDYKKSNLGGFANKSDAHGLVVASVERNDAYQWQEKTECIGWSNDYKTVDGKKIYQSQLSGILAFSKEQRDDFANYKVARGYLDSSNNWVYEYDDHGNIIYDYPYKDCAYVESGLIAHLLQIFYNEHLNNSDYTVKPVSRIHSSTTIPKLYGATTRPATTGWFLPGKLEWDIVHANYAIVNNALSQTNAGKELGNTAYWSTEETWKDNVCIYRPGASSNYRTEVKKTSTAAVRGVFWL